MTDLSSVNMSLVFVRQFIIPALAERVEQGSVPEIDGNVSQKVCTWFAMSHSKKATTDTAEWT